MTRSRCRSKSKSNRLKRNKTKRYRQTKNKRRRQHGGTVKYPYTLNSVIILKEGAVSEPVLIPGYSEIMDMMQEYEDSKYSNGLPIDQSKKLNDGIKIKNVEQLSDCSLPPTPIHESKIIVVRKADKNFFTENASIECNPNQYYALASHNFRIFIRDILQWNPFLNLPQHKKKQEQQGSQGYGGPHNYKSDTKFKDNAWWNQQEWWTDCKETLESAAQQSSSQPSSTAQPSQLVNLSLILGQPQPLNTQLSSLTTLINNNLQHVKNLLDVLIKNSREKYKYSDIEKNIEKLSTSIQTLNRLTTPQIDTSQLPS
jgi:hypothetical protein